jgi:hypothetical protein
MIKSIVALACAGVLSLSSLQAASNYAARVVSYAPGLGHAPGYTHPETVLGEPSRVNPFGDAVEPFNAPYGTNQVLSIGEGGSLVIQFNRPVWNNARRPHGLDFIIFGNAGFVITNDFDPNTYEWIGTPATDGSMYGANQGVTRVSVSRDGRHFFVLDTNQAPTLDVLYPTDGSGRFDLAVDPTLSSSHFAGATVEDIRELYRGAAGGAAFNMTWARNSRGRRVSLGVIRYVKIEVLSGKVEIDGFSAVERNARRR